MLNHDIIKIAVWKWKYFIIEKGVVVVVRHKAGDEEVDWAQVFEEKQSLEEVQRRAKGGTAIILSGLRAVTDLSGLRGEGGGLWCAL